MKKMILGLILSFSAFAGTQSVIYPQVYNYNYNVQVTIWNHTDKSVNCSGSLTLWSSNGGTQTEYISERVSPKFTFYRSFYPRISGDRFTNVTNNIFCY
jgi:hypothetical protein